MIKTIHRYFRSRIERYYLKNRWHFVLDLSLLLIVIILTASVISLYSYRPDISWLGGFSGPVLDLNNPPLELKFDLSGDSLDAREGANLKINFKNNGADAIKNIKVNFAAIDEEFSIRKLELTNDEVSFKINGKELVLDSIPAGEETDVELKIYFSTVVGKRLISWQAQSEYIFSGKLLKKTFVLPQIILKAELSVKSAAYYTSPQGDQLGVGPLPPIVGIPTTYWMFWSVKGDDDFKNLVLSARLPNGVELADGRSLLSGEFNYNDSSRQIIWKVPEIKGGEDNNRLGFEIRLIPTTDQVGMVLPLLNSPRYYAEDSFTNEEKTGSFSAPNTNLADDSFNSGEGKVISD
ncbi:MAG: hypothetical protein WC146_02525 [Patescibacteria group bacterium]|jgi:hypothetical protein